MSDLISIAIDNFGRSYMLPFLIKCYERQSRRAYEEGEYEIELVIVDDHSQDHFVRFLRLALDIINPPFKVRAFQTNQSMTYNPGLPLNIAVKKSEGDLILLNHSDLFPHPKECLDNIWKWHSKHPDTILVPTFIFKFDEMEEFASPLPNGLSLPKWMFEKVGGYDERFYGGPSVDADLIYRLRNQFFDKWFWDRSNPNLQFLHIGTIAHVPPRMRTAPWRKDLIYYPIIETTEEGDVREAKTITKEEFCLQELHNYNNNLCRANIANPIVNENGWGELDTLEEIKL